MRRYNCNHHWIWKNGYWDCKKCKKKYNPMRKELEDLNDNWRPFKENN